MQRGVLCWLALLAGPAAGADAAIDWLDRADAAMAQLHYRGVVVYLRDGQLDAVRIAHRADPDGARERLLALTGEPRELQRHGALAELNPGRLQHAAPALSVPHRPSALLGSPHYTIALAGNDRVAGRPVQTIDVRPRDGYRYGLRLWIDRQHALVLKSVAFGADGRAVEQWMFAEIDVGQAPDDSELGSAAAPVPPAAGAALVESRWRVADLPPGFEQRAVLAGRGGGEQHLYCDPLACVSLYIEPLEADAPNLSGGSQRGALSVFGRLHEGRQQVVAVGRVPPSTVERIVHGVVARDDA